ncbi:MAG: hypothetical protein JW982_08610 [Spirochaetes bacterium]|nr:hypothetical protein [Spirochaetota bacterium]
MILIICAVILALAGFLLVFNSLEIKKESELKRDYLYPDLNNDFQSVTHNSPSVRSESVVQEDSSLDDFDDVFIHDETDISFPENLPEETAAPEEIDVEILEDEDISIVKPSGISENKDDIQKFDNVVLYEDVNSIISDDIYDKSLNLQDFSKLKRIGKGVFKISKNSFEYSFDKKQFRFDFTRIKGITGEKNFILIRTKERDYQLFFMSESNANFCKIVKSKFKI